MVFTASNTLGPFFMAVSINGSQDGEILSRFRHCELSEYFLFYFHVPDCPFRTVVVGRDIGIVKECKDVITMIGCPLWKSDQFFMFLIQRLFQQGIQLLPKVVSGLIRATVVSGAKSSLKLLSL